MLPIFVRSQDSLTVRLDAHIRSNSSSVTICDEVLFSDTVDPIVRPSHTAQRGKQHGGIESTLSGSFWFPENVIQGMPFGRDTLMDKCGSLDEVK